MPTNNQGFCPFATICLFWLNSRIIVNAYTLALEQCCYLQSKKYWSRNNLVLNQTLLLLTKAIRTES
nr:hypothetical protein Iba_chr14dCG7630 [Ipomoea batatas]